MFDAMADWMTVPLLQQEAGVPPQRIGLAHTSISPYGAFRSRDGVDILISIQSDREWRVLAEKVLDDTTLAADPAFATNVERVKRRGETDGRVAKTFGALDADALEQKLAAADIAFARVNSPAELARHPHLRRITVGTPSGPVSYPAPAERHAAAVRHYGPVPAHWPAYRQGPHGIHDLGFRHGRACPAISILKARRSSNGMPGTRPGLTNGSSEGEMSWTSASSVWAIWARTWRGGWSRPATKSSSTTRARKRSANLAARGAVAMRSPKEIADAAETVMVSLPTPDIVLKVATGPDGVIEGKRVRRFVDLSTTGSVMAQRIFKLLAAKNIVQIDAPVSGGVKGAEKGTVAVMASGPRADVEAVEPALKMIGKFFYIGDGLAQARR